MLIQTKGGDTMVNGQCTIHNGQQRASPRALISKAACSQIPES